MPDREALAIHNERRPQARRNEAKYSRNRAKRIGIVQSFNPYEDHILRVRGELNAVLELWFEVPLFCAEDGKAAALLYNDRDGPIIHLGPGRQGKSETDNILDCLDTAAGTISGATESHGGGLPSPAVDGVEQLLATLPFPQSLLFEKGWLENTAPADTHDFIVGVRATLAQRLAARPRQVGREKTERQFTFNQIKVQVLEIANEHIGVQKAASELFLHLVLAELSGCHSFDHLWDLHMNHPGQPAGRG